MSCQQGLNHKIQLGKHKEVAIHGYYYYTPENRRATEEAMAWLKRLDVQDVKLHIVNAFGRDEPRSWWIIIPNYNSSVDAFFLFRYIVFSNAWVVETRSVSLSCCYTGIVWILNLNLYVRKFICNCSASEIINLFKARTLTYVRTNIGS